MLKVKFWRIENVVLMKVLEQGKEIKRGNFSFKASNGVEIGSSIEPLLSDTFNTIYIRGVCYRNDSCITMARYNTIEEAKEKLVKYQNAITEYNNFIKEKEIDTIVVGE